jgi:hypothetical protein
MEYLSKTKILEKKWILEFVPLDLIYLTQQKKIEFKGKKLKTEYLIHFINYMICKYYHREKKEVRLWSEVLRKWYGTYYNFYIEYLIENEILIKTRNYCSGLMANEFTLNEKYYSNDIKQFTRWKNANPFILKKWKEKQLEFEIQNLNSTHIINPHIKKQLIDDLYHIEIDFESASNTLIKMYENGEIETDKSYMKNLLSVESIQDGTLFYIEDKYGRLHTNFTILKKVIRKEYIKIDGEEVEELDIPNSQPTFLAIYLKEKGFDKEFPEAYKYYKNIVKDGKIYDLLAKELGLERNECKVKMFYVLFGENKWNSKIDIAFKKYFPEVFKWMVKQKIDTKNYKVIAHELQLKESKLVFDNIVYRIKKEIPQIRLFTVHDSIIFPKKYNEKVREIFYNHVDALFA